MKYIFIFFFVLVSFHSYAQNKSDSLTEINVYKNDYLKNYRRNVIYLGLFGNNVVYSFCLEIQLHETLSKQSINLNLGYGDIGYFNTLPLQLNKTFGFNRRYELGIGGTFINESDMGDKQTYFFPTFQASLRFQSRENPLYLKIGLTKFFFVDDKFRKELNNIYPGINFGYSF